LFGKVSLGSKRSSNQISTSTQAEKKDKNGKINEKSQNKREIKQELKSS